jgi:RNA polymerase-binding transcription factor DksA
VYCPDCAQHEWPELFFVQFRAADPSELPKGSEHVWHTWLSAFEDRGDAEASMASLKGGMPRMDYVSARNDPPVRRSLALTYRVVSRSELREEGEDALRRAENDTWGVCHDAGSESKVTTLRRIQQRAVWTPAVHWSTTS